METITTLDQMFACYDSVVQVSARMVDAARKDAWDTVIELQKRYSAMVDLLRPVYGHFKLDASQRARVEDLIRRILANESEVRERTTPRLARLSALIASNQQTQALHKAYGLSSARF
jgi:flagellar protein FliT